MQGDPLAGRPRPRRGRSLVGHDGPRRRADLGIGVGEPPQHGRLRSTRFRVRPGSRKKPASWMAWRRDSRAVDSAVKSGAKAASSSLDVRLIEEAELAVVADVDHGLGLAGIRAALEKRSVERLEHRGALEVVAAFERGQDGSEQHVALKRSRAPPGCAAASPAGSASMFFWRLTPPPRFSSSMM